MERTGTHRVPLEYREALSGRAEVLCPCCGSFETVAEKVDPPRTCVWCLKSGHGEDYVADSPTNLERIATNRRQIQAGSAA